MSKIGPIVWLGSTSRPIYILNSKYGGKQKIVQKKLFKVSTCLEKKVLNISQ